MVAKAILSNMTMNRTTNQQFHIWPAFTMLLEMMLNQLYHHIFHWSNWKHGSFFSNQWITQQDFNIERCLWSKTPLFFTDNSNGFEVSFLPGTGSVWPTYQAQGSSQPLPVQRWSEFEPGRLPSVHNQCRSGIQQAWVAQLQASTKKKEN